jgi:hypothetical protein
MPVSLPPDSEAAKNQKKGKRLAALYNLDRLDVSINPLNECIDVMFVKNDDIRHATINQTIIDWRTVDHVINAMLDGKDK